MIQKRFALIYPRVDDKPHSTRVKESSQSKIGQIISSVNAMRNVEDCFRNRNRAIINTSFKIKMNATISLTCNKSRWTVWDFTNEFLVSPALVWFYIWSQFWLEGRYKLRWPAFDEAPAPEHGKRRAHLRECSRPVKPPSHTHF